MNKEIIYSNDLSKVNKAKAIIESEDFRRRFVLVTQNDKYYVYKDKRYDSQNEAIQALKKWKIKPQDVRFIDQWGGWSYGLFTKFLAGDNDEWLDIITFQTSMLIKGQDNFTFDCYNGRVFRIYKDHKFKIYDWRGGWQIHDSSRGYYSTDNRRPEEIEDLKFGLFKKDNIYGYMPLGANDVDSESQYNMQSHNNYRRYLAKSSKEIIMSIFNVDESKINTWINVRAWLKKPGTNEFNKASITRDNLLKEVFRPMCEKLELPQKEFTKKSLDYAKKYDYKPDSDSYWSNNDDKAFFRANDWIIFAHNDVRYFYNVKTKKRYMINYYTSGWRSYRDNTCNIGIFNVENLISYLSNYGNKIYRQSDTWYKNGKREYSNCHVTNGYDMEYKNPEYDYAPRCFNEDGEEISPFECFAGTIVTDFLEIEKDWDYKVIYGYETYNSQPVKPIHNICKFEQLIELKRCPGLAFLLLNIKADRRTMAEQLFKLKLNGMLLQVLINPDSFRDKKEDAEDRYSWSYRNVFCSYDRKGSNLKKMFNVPMDKIRLYDEMLSKEYDEQLEAKTHVPSIAIIQEFLGDGFMNIDNETFKGYLSYATKFVPELNNIKTFKDLTPKRSPKETLAILNNVGNLSLYTDYLRLRMQYFNCFEGDERAVIEKSYKLFPEKARKFKYLRDHEHQYYYSNNVHITTVQEQLETIKNRYHDVTVVYNDENNIVGAVLNLTPCENVRFLHDELSEFVAERAKEIEAKGFKQAATRLLKWEYQGKELSIVAPKESKELAIEGGELSHCVAGFINPIINNKENVLFIRRNDMLKIPYYTIAIDNKGRIEQIHGYRNNNLTEASQREAFITSGSPVYNKTFDLIKFLKEWASNKPGLVDPSTICTTYGALCARQ